ncbi:MAG: cell division topological specificity factor MinE [Clostridia bacterium]|nr:cell division topological specificity factor MinE [Clostridia bacterium]
MRENQAERLNRVLIQDKSASPQRLLPALKSDLRDLIRQYGELANDIAVEIQECNGNHHIILVAKVSRFKSCGNAV